MGCWQILTTPSPPFVRKNSQSLFGIAENLSALSEIKKNTTPGFLKRIKKLENVKTIITLTALAGVITTVITIFILKAKLKKTRRALKSEACKRKMTADRLKISEQRFSEIAENASEWIWEVDSNGLYIYSSPAVKDILGYTAEEIIGRKYFYDFFDTKVREKHRDAVFKSFSKKEKIKNFTASYTHKDGRDIWVSTSGVPMLNEQGRLIGYRGADIDIIKEKYAAEQLQKSRQNLMTTINSIPFGVMVVGKDKKIKRINDAAVKMAGFDSKDELLGKLCHKTLCPAQVNNCPVLDAKQPIDHSEKILVRKNKTTVQILKSAVNINLGGEDVLLECFADITERK